MNHHKKVVCISGKGKLAIDCLLVLKNLQNFYKFDLLACPSRTQTPWQPSFSQVAQRANVPIVSLEQLYELNSDFLFISAQFDQIIDISNFPKSTFINIHLSLLPKYRGAMPVVWPIYYGDPCAGITIHEIDQGIDTGPVIYQKAIKISPQTRAKDLYETLIHIASKAFKKNAVTLLQGSYRATPQPIEGASFFTRADFARMPKELDPKRAADQVRRHAHALYFPEYQTATFQGKGVARCDVLPERSTAPAGTVVLEAPEGVRVATRDWDVWLTWADP